MCKITYGICNNVYELPSTMGIKATKSVGTKYNGGRVHCSVTLHERELIGIRQILKDIHELVLNDKICQLVYSTIHTYGIPQSTVFEDNEACLKFATLPKMSPRTKHIAIPYHFFGSKVKNLEVKVVSVSTDDQIADQFTKGLSQDKFEQARKNLMGW